MSCTYPHFCAFHEYAGPILESTVGVIFQKKGKEMLRQGKKFENSGKNVQNLETFWKKSVDCMWYDHMQKTTR